MYMWPELTTKDIASYAAAHSCKKLITYVLGTLHHYIYVYSHQIGSPQQTNVQTRPKPNLVNSEHRRGVTYKSRNDLKADVSS